MTIFKKNIYFFLFMIFSIFLSTFLWELIELPFLDTDIVGYYSINKINSFNDVLGYLIFITIPILFYFIWKIFFEKKNISIFFSNIKFIDENISTDKKIYLPFLLFIFFIILEFLSVGFLTGEIDLFHEGERLSAAFKSKLDGSLWSGSYISKGIIYEILGPKYIWNFFQQESIGLLRFLDLFCIFLTKIILIFLSLELAKNTNFKPFFKSIFFIFLTIVFLRCTNYTSSYNIGNGVTSNLIKFREIPVLLTLFLFIKSLRNINQTNILFFFIGFLTVFTFFWSIDRAIVLNLLVLFIILFLILNKSYKNIILLLLSILSSWLLFYIFFGEEFIFFVSNTIGILTEMPKINGLMHPIPFTDGPNASRSTKTILSILISLLISISFFFNNKDTTPYRFKVSLTIISFVSFLSYIYALGRTDYTHLRQVFGYPIIFLSCYLLFSLILIFQQKFLFDKLDIKKISLILVSSALLFLVNFNIKLKDVFNFKERFIKYIQFEDEIFLSKSDKNFIKKTSSLIKNEKCIQLYTNDAALLYLLKKPNCTKYFYVAIIGSEKNQMDLINGLNDTNFIIGNGVIDKKMKIDNWAISLDVKYPLLKNYINKYYENELIIDKRKILSKKKIY